MTKTTGRMKLRDLEMLDSVIEAYYERNVTGGSLHIVLDDGNWRRDHIEFCLEWARNHDDPVGEAISKLLLRAPDGVIRECEEVGWTLGLQMWKDIVSENV